MTIRRKEPVTVESLAVWQTVSKGLALAKEIVFSADGKEVLKTTLGARAGQQKFLLSKPATFTGLTLKVLSTYPGANSGARWARLRVLTPKGATSCWRRPAKCPVRRPSRS